MSLESPRLRATLSLTFSSKITEVFWLTIDELFALELVIYRRCFLAQPILSALQRYSRLKCAHLLRDLVASADLPPHSAPYSLQLQDLAHRWSEREDIDIHIFDVLLLAATVYNPH